MGDHLFGVMFCEFFEGGGAGRRRGVGERREEKCYFFT